MVKINENEVIISRHELFVLVGAAGACAVRKNRHFEKYGHAFMDFAIHIYCHIAWHIWEGKKLPEKSTNFLLGAITPSQVERKKAGSEICEDKQSICNLLLAVLQKTRAFRDITELKYDPYSGVMAVFRNGGYRLINVEGDSGIAMIRDILAHL